METKLYKGIRGWCKTTRINGIEIFTMKRNSGLLVTTGMRYTQEAGGICFTFDDTVGRITYASEKAVCTKRAIVRQHDKVLESLDIN